VGVGVGVGGWLGGGRGGGGGGGGKLNPISGHFGAKNQENPTTTRVGGYCSLLPHFS